MVQGFFFLKIMAANDSEYLASQPQSSALVFRGFEAPGKQAGGLFSAKNGPAGPGIGGGAYQQALCAWFYQRPACQYMYGVIVVDSLTRPMTDLTVEFKLLDSFIERHAVILPMMCILPPFYFIGMK
jgi:hypothetical protein